MWFVVPNTPTANNNGANNNPYGINIQTKEQAEQEMVRNNYVNDLAKSLGMELNDQTRDYLYQYILNEKASKNAWDRSVFAAQNQYQWLVKDLQKAGLNPFLALSGMNAASAQSSGGSVTGGLITSKENNRATNQKDMMKAILTGLVSIIGIMAIMG